MDLRPLMDGPSLWLDQIIVMQRAQVELLTAIESHWSRMLRESWDLWAVERASGRALALTRDAAGELEPAWEADGRGLVFASDRRRGLGSTALYRVGFAPGDAAPAGR